MKQERGGVCEAHRGLEWARLLVQWSDDAVIGRSTTMASCYNGVIVDQGDVLPLTAPGEL